MIQRKHILTLMLLLVGLAGLATSCYHTTTSPTTPPPSPAVVTAATLLDASNTCVTIEDSLTAANHAIDQLKATDPEYYAKLDPLIKKISRANTVAAEKIKLAKDTGATDWKPALLAVAASVNISDLTAGGIKNPTSQTIATAALASLVAILNTINQNFGGVK
jgi:hypothetical protein